MSVTLTGIKRIGDLLNPKTIEGHKTRTTYSNMIDMFGNDLKLIIAELQLTINDLRFVYGASQYMETGSLVGAESYLERANDHIQVVSRYEVKRRVWMDLLDDIIEDPPGTSNTDKVSMSYVGMKLMNAVVSGSYSDIITTITDSTALKNIQTTIEEIDTGGDIGSQINLEELEDAVNVKLTTLTAKHALGVQSAEEYYDYLLGDGLTTVNGWRTHMDSTTLTDQKDNLKNFVDLAEESINTINNTTGAERIAAIVLYQEVSKNFRIELSDMIDGLTSFRAMLISINTERDDLKYQIVTKQIASHTATTDLKAECIAVIEELDALLNDLRDVFYNSIDSGFII